jgi:hypothetical protein
MDAHRPRADDLEWSMAAQMKSWIHVAVTKDGLHWPGRTTVANSAHIVRISGRWLSPTEFQVKTGDVLVVPAAGPDGWREGSVNWRDAHGMGGLASGSAPSIYLLE